MRMRRTKNNKGIPYGSVYQKGFESSDLRTCTQVDVKNQAIIKK
jgi:hypothetical protein